MGNAQYNLGPMNGGNQTVRAAGQVIPVPAGTSAHFIGILTAGVVYGDRGIDTEIIVNYTDGARQFFQAYILNWAAQGGDNIARRFASRHTWDPPSDTWITVTAHPTFIFELRFPTDPDRTIASIELPHALPGFNSVNIFAISAVRT